MLRALRSRRVVTPQGVRPATIWLRDGLIERVAGYEEVPPQETVVDYGSSVISPGVVDAHVHINEPGRTAWEGFETATRAAVAGGVTTLVEMPLNASPVTTDLPAWEAKIAATAGKICCDCGFYGGLIPGNTHHLKALLDAGALGIKAFLVHSGLDEFPAAGELELRAALPILARRGATLLVHAELDDEAAGDVRPDSRNYADYRASRPPSWELRAIRWMIELCREYQSPIHIVHLAAAAALPELQAARDEGLPITVETAPHYLTFAGETIAPGSTQYKCAPPIRDAANREALWGGLRDGIIDFIASDHSPCPPEMKQLDSGFQGAWGGIASLQWTLPIVWTGARRRGFTLEDVMRWTSSGPAQFLKIDRHKGAIAAGNDADFAVWNPEATFTVHKDGNYHRHKVTPYEGIRLEGLVEATFLRGSKVFESGEFAAPQGRVILSNVQ